MRIRRARKRIGAKYRVGEPDVARVSRNRRPNDRGGGSAIATWARGGDARRSISGTGRTRHARPPRELDFHGLALEGAAARRGREDQPRWKREQSQPRLTKASSVRRARRGRPSARDARSRVANAPWRVSAFQRRSGGAFRLLRSLFDTRRGALVPRRGGRVGGHGFTLRRAFPSKNKHPLLDISYPPLRPSRRAQRCGDPYAPRVRPPRDPDLRAGAALVDCAIEERGSLDTRSRKVISRPSTTQVDDDKTSFSSPARNEARVFCRPTIFPRPATTPRTRHVSSCAPRVVRASAVERFGSPEGSRDPRVLGRRVSSRNRKASFKRDAHAGWRRLTGPPWGHQASAPPRRRTARR